MCAYELVAEAEAPEAEGCNPGDEAGGDGPGNADGVSYIGRGWVFGTPP